MSLLLVSIKPSVVQDLGIMLDCEHTVHDYISRMASTCLYHLHSTFTELLARQQCNNLCQHLYCTNYCNAMLTGIPLSSLAPVQHVFHAAVCLMTCLGSRDHHWKYNGNILAADRVQDQDQAVLLCILQSWANAWAISEKLSSHYHYPQVGIGKGQQPVVYAMFRIPKLYSENECCLWPVHSNGMLYHLTFATLPIVQLLLGP